MSYPVKHMCGYELEKSSALHPGGGYYAYGPNDGEPLVPITHCPRCGEPLCDTDLTTLNGEPLVIPNQTEWSKERRRARGWVENP